MKKKIVPFILSLILLCGNIVPAYAASVGELNNEKADIQGQITEAEGKKDEVEEQLTEAIKEIEDLDNSIGTVEKQIAQLTEEISSLETSIEAKQKELDEKQEEHNKNQSLMENRLVVMYETGETSFLDMLFSSKSIVEFISNYYLLQQLTQCDRELLDTIEKEQEEITNAKQELEQEKTRLDSAKNEQETKNNILKSQRAERQQKANSLTEEEKALQSEIEEKNKKLEEIERQIAEQLKDINQTSDGIQFDGSFIWPCDNKIVTSTVKNRWGRKHKGIDIGARWENVYATASGYAYTLENPGGYGHYIVIIHGNNYMSLYGHLNTFKVSYGQYVTQGQVIAQSGDSGSSTAPHLHFELRRASSVSAFFSVDPLNPLNYLPGGYTFAAGATVES